MSVFKELEVTKSSISNRRLVCGVGVNDAAYKVTFIMEGGKQTMCPYYKRWKNMIKRCYNLSSLKARPRYKGCSVCTEWLLFSNFRSWMEKQDWMEKQLDKDILVPDNKVYSPDTCIFVSTQLNNLLGDHAKGRGKYPQGVAWHAPRGKYKSHCSVDGRNKHIGYFTNIIDAEIAYCDFKSAYIMSMSGKDESSTQPILQAALNQQADIFNARSCKLSKEKEYGKY